MPHVEYVLGNVEAAVHGIGNTTPHFLLTF
jgi:hypothetical protein